MKKQKHGRTLSDPAATATPIADTNHSVSERLSRLRRAHRRSAPLDCGCKWTCWCTMPPLSDHQLDGWALAADYVMATTGCAPRLPLEVLRALYRRGGDDRALAVKLHGAAGGAIA